MSAQPKEIRWFRSQPTSAAIAASKINPDTGVIEDVVMVETGPAKGYGVDLEEEFITDLVAYGQRVFGARGVKARFGHPGASDNTMGMQMGFYRNIRKRKGADGQMQAIGNLHLLDAAESSPTHPGMRSYILKMAAESPDFMMSSIVFHEAAIYQRDANNHKVYIASIEDANPDLGKIFLEFGTAGVWYFTDLVDQGAATNNLFSAEANPHFFVSEAETFFAEHPHLISFLQENPQKVLDFLARMGLEVPAPKPFSMSKLLNFLTGTSTEQPEGDAAELAAMRTEFAAAQTQVKALQTERDELVTALRTANDEIKSLGAQLMKFNADLETATARIADLEAEPGDQHSGGEPEPPTQPKTERAYQTNPITERAQKIRAANAVKG